MTSNELHGPPDAARIGAWLKWARERQDRYSQEQAAPLLGTTTRTLGAWERGETVPPADKFFTAVALYEADDALADWLEERRAGKGSKRSKLRATARDAAKEA